MKKQISILSAMCLALLSGGAASAFANSATQPQPNATGTAATNIDNQQAYSFVTLTFHDVRDDVKKRGDRDVYAVSTKNFAQFLAWIKKNGCRADEDRTFALKTALELAIPFKGLDFSFSLVLYNLIY